MSKSTKVKPEVFESTAEQPQGKAEGDQTANPETDANNQEAECERMEEAETAAAAQPDKAEEEELQTRFLRLAADFQNYKRRVEKEKSDIYAFANEKIMTELLEVIDNFDRAISADCIDTAMLEGMKMIEKQFIGVLEKNGLAEIKAEGEIFDPGFHHAVMMEASESHKSGEVTEVLKKGYLLNQKVIRPAMVKVAE